MREGLSIGPALLHCTGSIPVVGDVLAGIAVPAPPPN